MHGLTFGVLEQVWPAVVILGALWIPFALADRPRRRGA